jgi:hypothetical protein
MSDSTTNGVPRLVVLDEGKRVDVFDVVGIDGSTVRVRSPFLFELGEELEVEIERDGTVAEAIARVRAHVGTDDKITELELSEQTPPRKVSE